MSYIQVKKLYIRQVCGGVATVVAAAAAAATAFISQAGRQQANIQRAHHGATRSG